MRLMIMQMGGDYRKSFQRMVDGGPETYYGENYSVNIVAELKSHVDSVVQVCVVTPMVYDEMLPTGVRAIGLGFQIEGYQVDKVLSVLEAHRPTHLVLQVLLAPVLQWAIRNKIKVLVTNPNCLVINNYRNYLRGVMLASLLNHPVIEWVGSYGVNSSLRLKRLGVKAKKIIPWDFLYEESPGDFPVKTLPTETKKWKLFYVGSVSEEKGVGDILLALAELRRQHMSVKLTIAGIDSNNHFAQLAQSLQIADYVEFLGIMPNQQIESLMHEADVVLVPSRHQYPEGFPLTIHHALRSRTPIVASDHPMFLGYLRSNQTAMLFKAGDAIDCASKILHLLSNPALYSHISKSSRETWQHLRLEVKWGDLLHRWVTDSQVDRQWFTEHSLAIGRYTLPALGNVAVTQKLNWMNRGIGKVLASLYH